MAEYIEREAVKEAYRKFTADGDEVERAWYVIDSLPAADVQPVVHGHWRTIPMACYGGGTIREYECSVCEEHQVSESPFCPNCGAEMEVKE